MSHARRERVAVEDSVNGLRGLALLLIVVTHYVPTAFFSFNLAKPVAAVLFVATGYFLTSVLTRYEAALNGPLAIRAGAMLKILGLRHARVWPVLAIVVGLYVLLALADRGEVTSQILRTWPLYLAYMGNMPKILFEGEAFPSHFWLISAQEQLLVLYALAIVLLGLSGFRRLLWWMLPLSLMWRVVGALLFMPERPALALETPLAVADSLSLGLLLGFAVRSRLSRTELRRISITGAVLVLLAWAVLPNQNAVYFSLLPLGIALLGCAAVLTVTDELRAGRIHGALLGSAPLVLLGRMSLTLFLLHPLVNTVIVLGFPHLFGILIPWWLLMLIGPPLALGVSFVFFRLVETPIRGMRAGRGGPAPGAAAA